MANRAVTVSLPPEVLARIDSMPGKSRSAKVAEALSNWTPMNGHRVTLSLDEQTSNRLKALDMEGNAKAAQLFLWGIKVAESMKGRQA